MTITSLIKASLAALAVPPGLWLAGASPGVASASGFVAGGVLITWASRRIAQRNRRLAAAPAPAVRASRPAPAPPVALPERRLDRAPTGRGPRDVRCPSSHTLAQRQPARRRIDR